LQIPEGATRREPPADRFRAALRAPGAAPLGVCGSEPARHLRSFRSLPAITDLLGGEQRRLAAVFLRADRSRIFDQSFLGGPLPRLTEIVAPPSEYLKEHAYWGFFE